MAKQKMSLEDVAKLLNISIVTAAANERAGTLPFVRVGDQYTDPANAIDAYLMNRATGYQEPDMSAQNAVIRAADARLAAEQAETRRVNREKNERDQAIRDRNEAARTASLEAATGIRYA